jgi:ribosomal protein S6E (S10)
LTHVNDLDSDMRASITVALMGEGKRLQGDARSGFAKAAFQIRTFGDAIALHPRVAAGSGPGGSTKPLRITSVKSGLVLDVTGGSTQAGAPIEQWPAHDPNPDNQLWTIEPFGSGSRIRSVKCGLVLEVTGGSTQAGAPIEQWPARVENPENQLWTFERVL